MARLVATTGKIRQSIATAELRYTLAMWDVSFITGFSLFYYCITILGIIPTSHVTKLSVLLSRLFPLYWFLYRRNFSFVHKQNFAPMTPSYLQSSHTALFITYKNFVELLCAFF